MNTVVTLQIESTSLESTLNLAARIGSRLKGGEVIDLVSDLGGGKTVFVRGLAKGMGSADQVASPTFTISREYKAVKLRSGSSAGVKENSDSARTQSDASRVLWLHHFDFYRLSDAGIITDELKESINDPRVAVVIEWSKIVEDVLPKDRLTVEIEKTGDESRKIKLIAKKQHQHLIKKLAM